MDNQGQTSPNSSEGSKPSPKPNQKSLLVPVFLSALITALVAGGAVYAWQDSKLSKIKEEKNEKIQNLQEEMDTLEEQLDSAEKEKDGEDVSDDWRSYRNEEYGVKLEYPQGFQITEEEVVHSFDEFNWYRITFENDKGQLLKVEINPDGYGPHFTDRTFQIQEDEENKLVIENIKESKDDKFPELINFKTNPYEAENGNAYWVLYKAEEGSLEENAQLFEDILLSFQFLGMK